MGPFGPHPGPRRRDIMAAMFRFTLLDKLGWIPLEHQARAFAALDGARLAGDFCSSPWHDEESPLRMKQGDDVFWLIQRPVTEPVTYELWGETVTEQFPTYDEDGEPVMELGYHRVEPDPKGQSRLLLLSGSFKLGKSAFGGLFPAAHAIVPNLLWDLVGMEYEINEPEFEYLLETLLSEQGLNLPDLRNSPDRARNELGYVRMANRLGNGFGHLKLSNGATFVCRSLQRPEGLKGKERDGYTACEFYQWPSVESIRSIFQNLSKRLGKFVVPTTPDRPVVNELKEVCDESCSDKSEEAVLAGEMPYWRAITDIHRKENPYAFRLDEMMMDANSRSKEKFAVYWMGKSGEYLGSCFSYARGERLFTPESHPDLWLPHEEAKLDSKGRIEPIMDNFDPPGWYERWCGVDTGTNKGACDVLLDGDGNMFVIMEHANYRYIGGTLERLDEMTLTDWGRHILDFHEAIGGKWRYIADRNAQYKQDLWQLFRMRLEPGHDPEPRTDALREYFQHDKIFLAPWLERLPYELELAHFPDRETAGGALRRVKEKDHLVDPVEHVAAQRPISRRPVKASPQSPIMEYVNRERKMRPRRFDPHLGPTGP